ncbi:DUF92 domain-containing protein [Pedobacter cryoconitis]|uniref:Uncharacterized protein (TIGR00297 family) n=1 Tax=Pedobacter cryoconitis TaxID=188932 RepID=A0A327T2J6_9SPHI|nr:DUF92 domain-containing protein [Pedobacter cryoconitis]RAJ35471.1 uncharacterized protein (TIGR00297 family) [Pedobacter cryoconitis]
MLIQRTALSVAILLMAGGYFSVRFRKLTVGAAITGVLCGILIYLGIGDAGLALLAAFFLCGTLATIWGRKAKIQLDKPGDSIQRKPGQVLANAGTATILSCAVIVFPDYKAVLLAMTAGSFASATADTLSSELGVLYGKRFYNCLSWRKEAKGLDGAISLEGTLIGVAGAVLIALIHRLFTGDSAYVLILVFAGFAGNFSDSVLGASLERRNFLSNDGVNFLSTLFAAGITLLLISVF